MCDFQRENYQKSSRHITCREWKFRKSPKTFFKKNNGWKKYLYICINGKLQFERLSEIARATWDNNHPPNQIVQRRNYYYYKIYL